MSIFGFDRLATKTGLRPSQPSGKSSRDDPGLRLSLKQVIGTTTDSCNAFHCLPALNVYAVCAGPAVVLAHIDEQLNISQSFYRAGPNVVPTNSTASFYSPPAANNLGDGIRSTVSPFRDSRHVYGSPKTQSSAFADSPGKTRASTRTRSANCVTLSADCKFLAVGETGYNPRINIFAISERDSDVPLTTLSEHSNFGVRSVAFSPDCRWLCSLGNVNDGFVFLWSIAKTGAARLHSSNKCISNVQAIAWMGNNVITVGTRHVKVWRLEQAQPTSPMKARDDLRVREESSGSPAPKTFSGRNCILGSLVDSNFTCVAPLSESRAVLCTEEGEICLLDDTDQRQRLEKVADAGFHVLCVSTDIERGLVLVGGEDGKTQMLSAQSLMESGRESEEGSVERAPIQSPSPVPMICKEPSGDGSSSILAVGFMQDHSITVDARHQITIKNLSVPSNTEPTNLYEKRVPAHDSAVLGVSAMEKPNIYNADFMTWSSQGLVLFWTTDGIWKDKLAMSLEGSSSKADGKINELKVLRSSSTGDIFYFGDKLGNLGMLGHDTCTVRAHDGEINDLVLDQRDDTVLVASCGRDRTVQLFQLVDDKLVILQTLENEHAASVTHLLFADGGTVLLSSSADRTIVMRGISYGKDRTPAFFPAKVITLKASPLCMALIEDSRTLMVSTMERQIHQYDLKTGTLLRTIRATDSAKTESVPITSVEIGYLQSEAHQSPIIFGVSSTDKSIRAYDSKTSELLCREHGQLVISDLALLQQNESEDGHRGYLIVSTGVDGTVMVWELSLQPEQTTNYNRGFSRGATTDQSPRSVRPLRRVLSKSELLENHNLQDPSTPTRSQQAGRVRKKPSRLTMAAASRDKTPVHLKSTHHSPTSPLSGTNVTKYLRHQSPPVPLRQTPLASRTKRSSSDASLHRPPTTQKTADLASLTDKLCLSLQAFRKELDASAASLASTKANQLERELTLTLHAIGARKTGSDQHASSGANQDDLMDGWLAKMIDDRLALKLRQAGNADDQTALPGFRPSSTSGATEEHARP